MRMTEATVSATYMYMQCRYLTNNLHHVVIENKIPKNTNILAGTLNHNNINLLDLSQTIFFNCYIFHKPYPSGYPSLHKQHIVCLHT